MRDENYYDSFVLAVYSHFLDCLDIAIAAEEESWSETKPKRSADAKFKEEFDRIFLVFWLIDHFSGNFLILYML